MAGQPKQIQAHKSSARRALFATGVFLCIAWSGATWSQVSRVATFEQWPGVSHLIAYKDRIWLVNSQPYRDNNSADIYSYSVADNSIRYERSLFSQDTGAPVIFEGLLHWPYEDPRRSAGSGEYAVTDGTNWEWRAMESGSVMHVHAMNVCDGDLVAATGSWTGQLHRMQQNGKWQVQYDYPAATNRFSRIVSVDQLGDDCIVGASARGKNEAKLFSLNGDKPDPVSGWPASERVDNLTRHNNAIFAFVDSGNSRQLMRFDGNQSIKVELPEGHRPRAMHSDGDTLWLATHNANNKQTPGALWQYAENNSLRLIQQFSDVPISLTSLNGVVAIGTYSNSGGALLLYGQAQAQQAKTRSVQSLQNISTAEDLDSALVESITQDLKSIISDPDNTANYARVLRRSLGRHPHLKKPEFGVAVTQLLSQPISGEPTTMFTGQTISRQDLIRWFLVTTLAINGNGRIEPSWINPDHQLQVPDSGKVFDPSVASIVATGWLAQNDKATLGELITRLNNMSDPLWVKADVIGALTAITGQRFAYDLNAWNSWWDRQ